MEMEIEGVKLRFVKGDITECECDAIVNAANNQLWMGGGVAGAIKRKGGEIIEKEAVRKGPIPVGEAIVTTAGKLKAKYVIHAAGMGIDLKPTRESIANATRNALRRARELGISSIAFPAIGTGVGGFPVEEAADLMLQEIKMHVKEGTTLKEILLVLFDKRTFDAFVERARSLAI